jgi:hypothetical protein
VEKIVVLAESSEEKELLMACIQILFPECEIQISSSSKDPIGDSTDIQKDFLSY